MPQRLNPIIIVVVAAVLMLAGPAEAHRLKLFAAVDGGAITGSAYFTGGGRAVGVPVEVRGPDGALLLAVTTDAEGAFRFDPLGSFDHHLSVNSGDGHRADFLVSAEELPDSSVSRRPVETMVPEPGPGRGPETETATAEDTPDTCATGLSAEALAAVDAAVARHVRPLREALDAYENRVRVADVVGGLGAILGLFGAAAFLASRRRGEAERR